MDKRHKGFHPLAKRQIPFGTRGLDVLLRHTHPFLQPSQRNQRSRLAAAERMDKLLESSSFR